MCHNQRIAGKRLSVLERLHDNACERDRAGNRRLHFDQHVALILLYVFNPIVTSLRGIQQASELGCRHLLSHDPNGIEIQTYVAIMACLLIALWTGGKSTLRTYEMLCLYFIGLADEEELLAHVAKLQS